MSTVMHLGNFHKKIVNHQKEFIMRSMIYLLLLLLCSCVTKQSPESKEWTALYSIVRDSLIVSDTKDFKTLSDSILHSSDYFLKLYQNSVLINNQIQSRILLAEILDKKGTIINSIRITTDHPKAKNELIRHSLYIIGEVKLYPFNNVNELSNLYKKFDELSTMLEKTNRIK
jgi:hypothetical protein